MAARPSHTMRSVYSSLASAASPAIIIVTTEPKAGADGYGDLAANPGRGLDQENRLPLPLMWPPPPSLYTSVSMATDASAPTEEEEARLRKRNEIIILQLKVGLATFGLCFTAAILYLIFGSQIWP